MGGCIASRIELCIRDAGSYLVGINIIVNSAGAVITDCVQVPFHRFGFKYFYDCETNVGFHIHKFEISL